ncbi:resuscitation-promoting factor [Novibacillus thermophilus]|uniref:G5 domain-containing protein n=1 Tax=Novibacillus thermophilus TaxID=1471761 RepID=A0A1U9K8N1_9BACL|nr:resuscitation-promoting factor [Novibacillus thermophilus]AQS56380.1 hypothetical protein B0W44_12020 [Novibacillus thermophilus]
MKRKVVISIGILTVLALAGVFTSFAMQKEVTVTFNDGQKNILAKTWKGTLEEVLADAGVDVDALKAKYEPSVPWDQAITDDVHVRMTRVFSVTLVDGGESASVKTKQFTVEDFLDEMNVTLGELDEINVSLDSRVQDGMHIVVDRIDKKVKTEKDEIPFDTVKQKDANLVKGKEILAREGKAGEKITEITYVYKNGELIDKDEEVVKVIDPVDKVVKIGTKEQQTEQKAKKKESGVKLASRKSSNQSSSSAKSTPKSTPSGSVWDKLAACESGGNWSANTGNGYYGGLQFSLDSWRAVGGSGYPHEHSRETQIAMGKKLQARQGWDAWGACAEKLGLN